MVHRLSTEKPDDNLNQQSLAKGKTADLIKDYKGEYLCDLETGENLKTHKVYDKFYCIKI